MSTLKTNNIEHLDASTPSIQTTIGGGTILAGVSTVSGTLSVGSNITLNTDGSAAFAGSATIGTYDSTSNSTTGGQLNSIGKVVAQRTSGQGTSDVFAGYQGNSKNFSVTAEGYASFGGTNTQIFANGEVQLAANKINIQPDGSASFRSTGSVAALTGKVATNNGGYNCFRGVNSSDVEVFYVSHNGRVGATGGIIFGSDTDAANVLDDYEEGTWTVAMSNGITLYGTQDLASYVKIGSSVTVFGQVRVNNGNANANMLINNLPFACASQTENETLAVGSMRLYNAGITGAAVQVVCVTADGTNILYFNEVRDNNSDLPCQATSDGYYMFNITYRTSS